MKAYIDPPPAPQLAHAYIDLSKLVLPPALDKEDIGKTVQIVSDRLKIDGRERQHVAWNGAKHSNCQGKLVSVDATVLGEVTLDGAAFQNPIRGFAQVLA